MRAPLRALRRGLGPWRLRWGSLLAGWGILTLIVHALVAAGAGGAAAEAGPYLVVAEDHEVSTAHQTWLLAQRDEPVRTFFNGLIALRRRRRGGVGGSLGGYNRLESSCVSFAHDC